MKIQAALEILNSRRDTFGNCYFAFCYTDIKTGRSVFGTTSGGDSNISAVFNHRQWKNLPWDAIRTSRQELGVRDFNRTTKEWPHAGCTPEEIGNFIKAGLRKKRAAAETV